MSLPEHNHLQVPWALNGVKQFSWFLWFPVCLCSHMRPSVALTIHIHSPQLGSRCRSCCCNWFNAVQLDRGWLAINGVTAGARPPEQQFPLLLLCFPVIWKVFSHSANGRLFSVNGYSARGQTSPRPCFLFLYSNRSWIIVSDGKLTTFCWRRWAFRCFVIVESHWVIKNLIKAPLIRTSLH